MPKIGNDWDNIIGEEFQEEYYQDLRQFLIKEYNNHIIFPNMYDIFNALKYSSYNNTKIVILGQDPYHNPDQAHGLCFSVKKGIKKPPSLNNIFKELKDDVGTYIPQDGCLIEWAKQGILLLNTILTVRSGHPMSHKGKGWERFTDTILSKLNSRKQPIVFMLWGNMAKQKKSLLTKPHHYILETSHPSPLSAYYGFIGCKHFSKANDFLKKHNLQPINWQIT